MTIAGTIKGSTVLLDEAPSVPDGTRVDVVLPPVKDEGEPTLKNLLDLAGCVKGMPADFAEQHDHYIHGTPKR
jgi:hypothetical protein